MRGNLSGFLRRMAVTLKNPTVLCSLVSQLAAILVMVGINVDEETVITVISIAMSVLASFGMVSKIDLTKENVATQDMFCKRDGKISTHVNINGQWICAECGEPYSEPGNEINVAEAILGQEGQDVINTVKKTINTISASAKAVKEVKDVIAAKTAKVSAAMAVTDKSVPKKKPAAKTMAAKTAVAKTTPAKPAAKPAAAKATTAKPAAKTAAAKTTAVKKTIIEEIPEPVKKTAAKAPAKPPTAVAPVKKSAAKKQAASSKKNAKQED